MEINRDGMVDVNQSVDANYKQIEAIFDSVVSSYTKDLDELMVAIKENVLNVDNPSTMTIEKYFLDITLATYFVGGKLEKLGGFDGISKLAYKEKYNQTMISDTVGTDGKKRTLGELTALAENSSVYENVLNDMYARAYKTMKFKVDAAQTMCSTLSKIYSHKMQQEQQSYNVDSRSSSMTGRQVLNEGNYYG